MAAVLDYSWTHPDPGAMKRAGIIGVMRYIGGSGGGHDLSIPERDALLGAGLEIGLVFETSGTRMNGGAPAGADDARRANADADRLGFPVGRPLYFANDQNACTGAHIDYMRAARDNSPRPVGPYGNTALIDACAAMGMRYGWKVSTWGGPTGNACLIQEANARPPFNGTDLNTTTRDDWGQWGGQAAPPPKKKRREEEAFVLESG